MENWFATGKSACLGSITRVRKQACVCARIVFTMNELFNLRRNSIHICEREHVRKGGCVLAVVHTHTHTCANAHTHLHGVTRRRCDDETCVFCLVRVECVVVNTQFDFVYLAQIVLLANFIVDNTRRVVFDNIYVCIMDTAGRNHELHPQSHLIATHTQVIKIAALPLSDDS